MMKQDIAKAKIVDDMLEAHHAQAAAANQKLKGRKAGLDNEAVAQAEKAKTLNTQAEKL